MTKKFMTIDTHQDVVANIQILTHKNISQRGSLNNGKNEVGFAALNQVDIPRMKEGGLTAACWASCPEELVDGEVVEAQDPYQFTLDQIAFYQKLIQDHDELVQVLNVEDISRAQENGKIGVILSIEGAHVHHKGVEVLKGLHEKGIRLICLTWNYDNLLAEGAGTVDGKIGLTGLGRDVLREMNRIGITFDVAHLNQKGFWNVVEYSKEPFICSHTNIKKFYDHFRLLSDDQIRAFKDTGSVIGLSFYPKFINETRQASLSDLVDQIDYVAKMIGSDYVGLGSDFDGMIYEPVMEDLEDVSKYPNIVEELSRRDYADDDIEKIMGKNMLRVFEKTWK